MLYWVHVGSNRFGGELFGSYESAVVAAEAISRLALSAYEESDGVIRSYTILQADTKEQAEHQIKANYE